MTRRLTPEVRRFYQAALQRFEDAEVLLRNDRTTGALYLAGYAVECSLKALLLNSIPVSRQQAVVGSFRGQLAHDFEWLKSELRGRGVEVPAAVVVHLRRVNTWSTSLRYVAGRVKRHTVQSFLKAAEQVIGWTKGR